MTNSLPFRQVKEAGYSVLTTPFDKVSFTKVDHRFSDEILAAAHQQWTSNPGKFDGLVTGVKNAAVTDGCLQVAIFPMRYSLHRYFAAESQRKPSCAAEGIIQPLCVANRTYVVKDGIQHTLMGVKKGGHIDEGELETIVAGFCDFADADPLNTFVRRTLTRELEEEAAPGFSFSTFTYTGFGVDEGNKQYSFLTEFEVEESDCVCALEGSELEEHQTMFLVPDNELALLVRDPSSYVARKTRTERLNDLTIASIPLATLHVRLNQLN